MTTAPYSRSWTSDGRRERFYTPPPPGRFEISGLGQREATVLRGYASHSQRALITTKAATVARIEEARMCRKTSPNGNLTCSRTDCDGVGHVWEHPSAARDPKADADACCQD